MLKSLLLLLLVLVPLVASEEVFAPATRAVLLSCSGWRLNRLPEVKSFIHNEAQNFPNLEIKYVGGDPRIKFYNESGDEAGHVEVSNLSKVQIVDLLTSRGLTYEVKPDDLADNVGELVK